MRTLILTITATLTIAVSSTAQAFCGFYVARADTSLYNQTSQVVLVRDGNRTVITMANDFQGDVEDFAVVIPVPTFIEREQINVADNALIEHLDAYTAPRLVEYHDPDPCSIYFSSSSEFQAALELVFDGSKELNGYTERVLHARRREVKARLAQSAAPEDQAAEETQAAPEAQTAAQKAQSERDTQGKQEARAP